MIPPGDLAELGTYFKGLREKSGLTQRELSQRLGHRTAQLVSNWERGVCSPPLTAVAIMIQIFHVSQAEILRRLLKASKHYFEARLVLSAKDLKRVKKSIRE